MYVSDENHSDFIAATRLNRELWETTAISAETSNKAVYVDLFHDNTDYILRSLLIGRLIGQKLGLPVYGLTGSVGIVQFTCKNMSFDNLKLLAESFGVTVCPPFIAESHDEEFRAYVHQARDALGIAPEALNGSTLRQMLRHLTLEDGFPLGRFAYDSTLRSYLIETIETLDDNLIRTGGEILALRQAFKKQFEGIKPAYLVVGHIDYSPFGVLADMILRMGGSCAYFRNDGQMRVYLTTGVPEVGQTIFGLFREQGKQWQSQWLSRLLADNPAALEAHSKRYLSGRFHASYRNINSALTLPSADAKIQASGAAKSALGLQPDVPCIVLFASTLADITMHDAQVFDDNYQWLIETLGFAATQPDINWVVRIHPYDQYYNTTGAMNRLKDMYAASPNIKFMSADWPQNDSFLIADVVTTLRGTPGVQAAQLGLPVILAGHSIYSEAGFSDAATDANDYLGKLVTAALNPPQTQYKALLAQAFQYADDVIFGLPTTFLGDFGESLRPFFWQTMSRRIAFYSLVNDPFAIALSEALEHNLPRVTLSEAAFRFERPFEAKALLQKSSSQSHENKPRDLFLRLATKLKKDLFS